MKSQKVKTMSTAPNPNSSQTGTLTPDPLLKSGSFIDANKTEPFKSPQPNVNNGAAAAAAGTSNGAEPETSKKRRRSAAADTAWLPPGWSVEDRVRSSGATAGTVDKYYIDPSSGRKFRSKKEVEYFLQTGNLRQQKRATKNSDADTECLEGSRGSKSKKPKTKASASNFDFLNVPEKITWTWTVTYSSQDTSKESWTPWINGNEKVPDSLREEWAAAFVYLTTRNSGHTMI